jgi:mannose-6-phosphate isomerase-like protein (cupin superfamily)
MNDLKKTYDGSVKRKVDEFFEITDMSVNIEAKFNLVVGKLDGPHGKFINHVSDKGYFILEGDGEVYIGDEITQVSPYDFIFIPPNTPHGIKGNLKFIIITSPVFNPENECRGENVE